MKSKKSVVFLLSVVLFAMVFVMSACNTDSGKQGDQGGDTEPKSYQLVGKYDEAGSFSAYTNNAFMLDLEDGGTATLAKYAFDNYDTSAAATNTSFIAGYMTGSWEKVERDGAECLKIKLAVVNDDETKGTETTYYAYKVDGEYSFALIFPLMPGMTFTRQCLLSGTSTAVYANADAFIQGNKKVFVEPENIGKFVDDENNGTVYMITDGSFLMYNGYSQIVKGSWSKDSNGVTILINAKEVTVTVEGTKASFEYTYSMMAGYDPIEFTFTCADYTKLPDKSLPAAE